MPKRKNDSPPPVTQPAVPSQPTQDTREILSLSHGTQLRAEIEAAMIVAVRHGRDEDQAYAAMMLACERPTFQRACAYRYHRAGAAIIGPSVLLAREFARLWGHIRYGFEIIADSAETIHVRGYAWDLLTGTKAGQDASFKKLIWRRHDGGAGAWIVPDERELRELINRHGAIVERNCLLKILPRDMVEDVLLKAQTQQRKNISTDLVRTRREIIAAFGPLNITPAQLEDYLGKPLAQLGPDDLVGLRQVWTSIRDGHTQWADHCEKESTPPLVDLLPDAPPTEEQQ